MCETGIPTSEELRKWEQLDVSGTQGSIYSIFSSREIWNGSFDKKLVEREGLQALLKMNAYYSDQVPELASPKQSLGFSP